MKKSCIVLLLLLVATGFGAAEETSFRRVKLPDQKGKEIKAVLTFSDNDKAVEVHPVKGAPVTVPYTQIDNCRYEYTEELSIFLTASKRHWLQVDYHDHDAHKVLVLLLHKRNYIRILDALKAHTGIDAELFGNADKRRGGIWGK